MPPTKRMRALGNSVVPQCAEVIGHVILELLARDDVANDNAEVKP